ncbi:MAG: ECF RNA polymerase sigma factor SigW [Chlamydiae bacterium]|nr:ECF RNA polymerase sigma factor SigW [Chlamydiota bacterium]
MGEKELIERSQKGDEEAFSELMGLYQPKIFQHCLGIVKDEEIAQDLTQETFLHAYQHLDTFHGRSRFYTWIYRIAHNLSLNFLKKTHRTQEFEFKEELLPAGLISEDQLENEEFNQALQAALQTLPPKQRIVFEMYDLQHIPHKEIAVKLDISPGTVRSRLYYARRKLRPLLAQ